MFNSNFVLDILPKPIKSTLEPSSCPNRRQINGFCAQIEDAKQSWAKLEYFILSLLALLLLPIIHLQPVLFATSIICDDHYSQPLSFATTIICKDDYYSQRIFLQVERKWLLLRSLPLAMPQQIKRVGTWLHLGKPQTSQLDNFQTSATRRSQHARWLC